MSLTVPAPLVDQAQRGPITDQDFLQCIQTSLPYAWSVVSDVAARQRAEGGPFADNQVEPPDEKSRGELLRMLASDAMRGAIERHFGLRLAFQNCHRVALFDPAATAEYDEFVSTRAQVLNQKPELVNC